MKKIIASLSLGIVICLGNQIGEANMLQNGLIDHSFAIGNVSVERSSLAFKYELPNLPPKPNVNGRKRIEVKEETDTKELSKVKSTADEKKEKNKSTSKKKKEKKAKNKKQEKPKKQTKSDKYEKDASTSKTNIDKRKAALKQSGISKQEQKENEIIMNYQMQKVAVELARRKLSLAQDASPTEKVKLKNRLAEEEVKLKPLSKQFDSLELTLREENVPKERKNIIKIAKSYIGTPYILGGSGGRLETDCGQFTKDVMAECGKRLRYRTADGQYLEYQKEKRIFTDKDKLKPGDLVFYHTTDAWPPSNDPAVAGGGRYAYKGVTHVGIYQGDGRVIHASSGRGRVIENAMMDFAEIVGFGKSL